MTIYQQEPNVEPLGTAFQGYREPLVPLGTMGPTLAANLAGKLLFSLLALALVVVYLVWKTASRFDSGLGHSESASSRKRLLREIRRHE